MHDRTAAEAREIMLARNADYGADVDGLRNFRLCENLSVPIPVGILTRLGDKLARIGNLIAKGNAVVKDETIDDTILDAVNSRLFAQPWSRCGRQLCHRRGALQPEPVARSGDGCFRVSALHRTRSRRVNENLVCSKEVYNFGTSCQTYDFTQWVNRNTSNWDTMLKL
jgi:hypothetical protein